MSTHIKLGDIPLDSEQTIRKAWCDSKDGHRVIPVDEAYSYIDYCYDGNNNISTVSAYYKSTKEKTQVSFVADCCGSLDGTYFTFTHSVRDAGIRK